MEYNFKEKYDQIIDVTDECIRLKVAEIKKVVASRVGLNERLMQRAFSITSGMNYQEYIERRKFWNLLEYMRNSKDITENDAFLEFNTSKPMVMLYLTTYSKFTTLLEAVYFEREESICEKRYSYVVGSGYNYISIQKKIERALELYMHDYDVFDFGFYVYESNNNEPDIFSRLEPEDELKCYKLDGILHDFRMREEIVAAYEATTDEIDNATAISFLNDVSLETVFAISGSKGYYGWEFDEDFFCDEESINALPDEDYYIDGDWDYERWAEDISTDMGYMEDEEEDSYY